MIPHNRPTITEADRAAVDTVLASRWIAQGPEVKMLEASFVSRYGGGGACAVSSGTAALFLAMKALSIKRGDRVAVPTYACSALLNAINMAGATPVIVDVRQDNFCLDNSYIEEQKLQVDCIIAIHMYGAFAEISELRTSDRKIIEDCCHTYGGESNQLQIGRNSDAAIFSFYATKLVTGGQGGLVWARNKLVTEEVFDIRDFDSRESYKPRFNFQMTDISAAMINSQLKRLNAIQARRQMIAKGYRNALSSGLTVQWGLSDTWCVPYRFVVITPDAVSRDALKKEMEASGVECLVPIERYELLHRYLNLSPSDFPVAERLVDTTLSIPIHSSLTDSEIERITNALSLFHP